MIIRSAIPMKNGKLGRLFQSLTKSCLPQRSTFRNLMLITQKEINIKNIKFKKPALKAIRQFSLHESMLNGMLGAVVISFNIEFD